MPLTLPSTFVMADPDTPTNIKSECRNKVSEITDPLKSYYTNRSLTQQTEFKNTWIQNNLAAYSDLKTEIDKLIILNKESQNTANANASRLISVARETGSEQQANFENYERLKKINDDLDKNIKEISKKYTIDIENTHYSKINILELRTVNFYLILSYYILVILFIILLFAVNAKYPFYIKVLLTIFIIIVPFIRDILLSLWTFVYNIYTK